MTALITGGTGFLGSEIARLLLARGEPRVVLFDLNPSTQRLDDVAARVDIVRGDLAVFAHVLDAVQSARPSVVYHLGGMLSAPSDADHAAAFQANALGTFNVLEAARLRGVAQVLFASSISTYGYDMPEDSVDDYTLQRPVLFYGATKLFGEHMGRFFRRKYGLDFRGIRYPSIVGPGVSTPGISQYTSRAVEESARGNPYTIFVEPRTKVPIIYIREAASAMVKLAEAPANNIETVVYLIAGTVPVPSARELRDVIVAKVTGAKIDFKPDPEIQSVHDSRQALSSIDDSNARREWGWKSEYSLERIVDEMIEELRIHPECYT